MSINIGDQRQAGDEGPAGDQREAGEAGVAGDPRPAGESEFKASSKSDDEGSQPAKKAASKSK